MKKSLSYDDVLLVPQYSDIRSRSEVSTAVDLGNGLSLRVPILASPMDTISEAAMAVALGLYGGAAIVHRYNSIQQLADIVKTKLNNEEFKKEVAGVKQDIKKVSKGIMAKPKDKEIQ